MIELTQKQIDNFWNKVDIAGEDECWNWIGYTQETGFGYYGITIDKKRKWLRANRLAYFLHHGEIDPDLFVMTTCGNRKCMNPKHLYLGTPKEARNKAKINYKYKIDDQGIIAIRDLWAQGTKATALAERFGVSSSYIYSIVKNKVRN